MRPVVLRIDADPAANYEATLSVPTYLRSFGVTNALFLDPAGLPLPEACVTWQERDLATSARNGGHRFAPWEHLTPEQPPIDVRIGRQSSQSDPHPSGLHFP